MEPLGARRAIRAPARSQPRFGPTRPGAPASSSSPGGSRCAIQGLGRPRFPRKPVRSRNPRLARPSLATASQVPAAFASCSVEPFLSCSRLRLGRRKGRGSEKGGLARESSAAVIIGSGGWPPLRGCAAEMHRDAQGPETLHSTLGRCSVAVRAPAPRGLAAPPTMRALLARGRGTEAARGPLHLRLGAGKGFAEEGRASPFRPDPDRPGGGGSSFETLPLEVLGPGPAPGRLSAARSRRRPWSRRGQRSPPAAAPCSMRRRIRAPARGPTGP